MSSPLSNDVEREEPQFEIKSPGAQQRITLAPALKLLIVVQGLLTLLCASAEAFSKFILHLGDPFDCPLLCNGFMYGDFTLYANKFRHFHGNAFFTTDDPAVAFMYPAPVGVMYEVFFSYRAHPVRVLLSFIIGCFVLGGFMLGRALYRRGVPLAQAVAFVAASMVLAYPIWFEIKQGNIEICVWALVAGGIWAFFKKRNYLTAALFGIAGSMKIFPFVYLGLLISRRKYRQAVFSALVAVAFTVLSLWLLGSTILSTWRHVEAGIALFRYTFMLHSRATEIGFDHSLIALSKRFWHPLPQPEIFSHLLTVYLAVAAVTGTVLYFYKIRSLPINNQVLCLCIASILLPPVSYDYTLMHLYVPLGLLALFAQDRWNTRQTTPGLSAAFICLAILLAPESEFIHHSERFGGQIKAIVLVVLFYIGLRYPFGCAHKVSGSALVDAP